MLKRGRSSLERAMPFVAAAGLGLGVAREGHTQDIWDDPQNPSTTISAEQLKAEHSPWAEQQGNYETMRTTEFDASSEVEQYFLSSARGISQTETYVLKITVPSLEDSNVALKLQAIADAYSATEGIRIQLDETLSISNRYALEENRLLSSRNLRFSSNETMQAGLTKIKAQDPSILVSVYLPIEQYSQYRETWQTDPVVTSVKVATDFSSYGLRVENVEGLIDWPQTIRSNNELTTRAPEVKGEIIRLVTDMRTMIKRNAWKGADAAFVTAETIAPELLTTEHYYLGAEAARGLGNINEVYQRLNQSLAKCSDIKGTKYQETVGWLVDIKKMFSIVSFALDSKKAPIFSVNKRPFAPDLSRSLDYINAQLISNTDYSGLIPKRTADQEKLEYLVYNINGSSFYVSGSSILVHVLKNGTVEIKH